MAVTCRLQQQVAVTNGGHIKCTKREGRVNGKNSKVKGRCTKANQILQLAIIGKNDGRFRSGLHIADELVAGILCMSLEIHGPKNGGGCLHREAICMYNAYTYDSTAVTADLSRRTDFGDFLSHTQTGLDHRIIKNGGWVLTRR